MERQNEHLSLDSIRDFAHGHSLLQSHELRHFQDCDECCTVWSQLKQEAKREKSEHVREKSA
jgi:hypothetical protein